MKKIHLDLSVRSSIRDAYLLSSEEIMRISGLNLGNLAFRHALGSMLEDFSSFTPVNYFAFKELIKNSTPDVVIISCANWLGTKEQDEISNKFRADLIEPLDCRVVSFGIGVQAPHGTEAVSLGPESQRLARVLSEKSALISVRDKLTEKTLRSIGIRNVCVTGCPSNFINTRPSLGTDIALKAEKLLQDDVSWASMRTAISEFTGGNRNSGAVLRNMFAILEGAPSFYVLQSPDLLPFLLGENSDIPPVYVNELGVPLAECKSLLLARMLFFSGVDGWLDFSRTCDFSFGMRIHGTMVPLQSGVPSLLIGHDSRTSGLGDEMGIPMLSGQEFIEVERSSPAAFLRIICERMQGYDPKRRLLAQRFLQFLQQNNIPYTQELTRLADPHAT